MDKKMIKAKAILQADFEVRNGAGEDYLYGHASWTNWRVGAGELEEVYEYIGDTVIRNVKYEVEDDSKIDWEELRADVIYILPMLFEKYKVIDNATKMAMTPLE